ncbi:hypothetical protein IMY05_004G0002800 [Salix suchowensis]|nr:hypothetical protein IMY05_004G0002800 [Salix suchowensis]
MKANIWVIFEGLTKNVTFPMKTQVSISLLHCHCHYWQREREGFCFSPICGRRGERNGRLKRGSKRNSDVKWSAAM